MFIPFQREQHKGISQRCETSQRKRLRDQGPLSFSFKGMEHMCMEMVRGKNPNPETTVFTRCLRKYKPEKKGGREPSLSRQQEKLLEHPYSARVPALVPLFCWAH